jgi:hypothetical protein
MRAILVNGPYSFDWKEVQLVSGTKSEMAELLGYPIAGRQRNGGYNLFYVAGEDDKGNLLPRCVAAFYGPVLITSDQVDGDLTVLAPLTDKGYSQAKRDYRPAEEFGS